MISHSKYTADYLLGRRYSSADAPDITITGLDPQARTVRVHCLDGQRAHLPLDQVIEAIRSGAWVESDKAPFVLEREPAARFLRRGVAGRGKVIHYDWGTK